MADFLGCDVGQQLMSYLGLNVGIKHWRISSWDKLVARVRERLAEWNDKHISFGERATLIQSVLSSIPIYCLSFNRIPKSVIKELIAIQRNFLWGGCEESRKTPWISWNTICKDKKLGGLGIRNLGRFNVSLLSKWIWRFLNEPYRLWARIIQSRHGGLDMVYERTTYREGARQRGVRNTQNTSGNGEGTDFWRDVWAVEYALCEKFNRLYRLSTQQEARVGGMGVWEEAGWKWDFKWNRGLSGREVEDANNLIMSIDRNTPRRLEQDNWRWKHSANGCFSTKSAYQLLDEG
ncbi:hypothetical protein ACS0TY_018771 [Phlomoides rotata]